MAPAATALAANSAISDFREERKGPALFLLQPPRVSAAVMAARLRYRSSCQLLLSRPRGHTQLPQIPVGEAWRHCVRRCGCACACVRGMRMGAGSMHGAALRLCAHACRPPRILWWTGQGSQALLRCGCMRAFFVRVHATCGCARCQDCARRAAPRLSPRLAWSTLIAM
jgi:hypothetical protein